MSQDARTFWDRTAGRYDLSMWFLGGPLSPMRELVADAVHGQDRVLELAAGTGLVTTAIAPVVHTLVATDYADAMVAKLQERVRDGGLSNVQVRALDLTTLDGSERFDAVVAANVLHLLPDLDVALNAMRSVLRPGGLLVVPTFCHDEHPRARITSRVLGAMGFPGQRRFTLDTLTQCLTARGLAIRRAELLPGLLPIGFVTAVHDEGAS